MTGLEDPAYQPQHPPIGGYIPEVVERWGPRSQLRWFDRFRGQLRLCPEQVWNRFYVHSTEHRGLCCTSCIQDEEEGYGGFSPGCCCKTTRS